MGSKQLPPVRIATETDAAINSVSGAFLSGTRLDELRAMYRVLAAHIDSENTLARDLAALMRQAREISKEIEELEAVEVEATSGGGGSFSGEADIAWRPEAI